MRIGAVVFHCAALFSCVSHPVASDGRMFLRNFIPQLSKFKM